MKLSTARNFHQVHADVMRKIRRVKGLDSGLVEKLENVQLDWYRIQNATADNKDTTTVYIYGEILDPFLAMFFGGVSAEDLIDEIKDIDTKNIDVHINSPGGLVFEAVAIFNALNVHDATINVYVDALAASAASVIAMAGDTITMMPGSQMMIHDASAVAIGNAAEMRDAAAWLDKQSDNIASVYAYRAGGEIKDWRGLMKAETWLYANEAVELGLADGVFEKPDKSEEEPPKQTDPEEEESPKEDETDPQEGEEDPSEEDSTDNLDEELDDFIENMMHTPHKLNNRGFKYSGRDKAPAPAKNALFTANEIDDLLAAY